MTGLHLQMIEDIVLIDFGDFPAREFPGTFDVGAAFDDLPQLLYLLPVDRIGTDTDLESIEIRWIMASCDHHAAIRPEMADRKIEHGGRAEADIGRIDSGGTDPPADGILVVLRAEAAIPAQDHCLYAMTDRIGADGPAQQIDKIRGQIPVHNPPDVILAKHIRIHFFTPKSDD